MLDKEYFYCKVVVGDCIADIKYSFSIIGKSTANSIIIWISREDLIMKQKARKTLFGLAIAFLSLIFTWAWFFIITRGENTPPWVGNMLAALTGGVFGIFGNLIAIWGQQIALKAKEKREFVYRNRERESKNVLDFLDQLRQSLIRLKTYQHVQNNISASSSAEILIPRIDEINNILKQIPVLPSWLSQKDEVLQNLDIIISEGIDLLLMEVESIPPGKIEKWEKECRIIIEKINECERNP